MGYLLRNKINKQKIKNETDHKPQPTAHVAEGLSQLPAAQIEKAQQVLNNGNTSATNTDQSNRMINPID